MDLDLVRQIIALVEEAGISELEVVEEGLRVVVKKHGPAETAYGPYVPTPIPPPPTSRTAEESADSSAEPPDNVEVIISPMVGTFYRAPAPDADPFVEMGHDVGEDTVVCILEAMKVMNEIKAGVRGKVAAILVENGQPVEYNQPLFHIRKSG
ncbi:MAG: acetyl-CoA carboxylase biotin carboxyl carrier protein [bacterium]